MSRRLGRTHAGLQATSGASTPKMSAAVSTDNDSISEFIMDLEKNNCDGYNKEQEKTV